MTIIKIGLYFMVIVIDYISTCTRHKTGLQLIGSVKVSLGCGVTL